MAQYSKLEGVAAPHLRRKCVVKVAVNVCKDERRALWPHLQKAWLVECVAFQRELRPRTAWLWLVKEADRVL